MIRMVVNKWKQQWFMVVNEWLIVVCIVANRMAKEMILIVLKDG